MTVIVYRDRQMAADTMARYNDTVHHGVKKIVFNEDIMVGLSGKASYLKSLEHWVASKPDTTHLFIPTIGRDSDGDGEATYIVYDKRTNRLTLHTADGIEDVTYAGYFAIGAAADMAIGALARLASAEEAVEICINKSPYCGGSVYSVVI